LVTGVVSHREELIQMRVRTGRIFSLVFIIFSIFSNFFNFLNFQIEIENVVINNNFFFYFNVKK
jgi:hypothetical protein